MRALVAGLHYSEIARFNHVSTAHVKKESRRICKTLGLKNRNQLTEYWYCELFQIGMRELGIYNPGWGGLN